MIARIVYTYRSLHKNTNSATFYYRRYYARNRRGMIFNRSGQFVYSTDGVVWIQSSEFGKLIISTRKYPGIFTEVLHRIFLGCCRKISLGIFLNNLSWFFLMTLLEFPHRNNYRSNELKFLLQFFPVFLHEFSPIFCRSVFRNFSQRFRVYCLNRVPPSWSSDSVILCTYMVAPVRRY